MVFEHAHRVAIDIYYKCILTCIAKSCCIPTKNEKLEVAFVVPDTPIFHCSLFE